MKKLKNEELFSAEDLSLIKAVKKASNKLKEEKMETKLNAKLVSIEIWDAATNDWQAYDCPKGDTVAEYADWCIGEHSEYWATINGTDDKIRLNGWFVIDGKEHFKGGEKN